MTDEDVANFQKEKKNAIFVINILTRQISRSEIIVKSLENTEEQNTESAL